MSSPVEGTESGGAGERISQVSARVDSAVGGIAEAAIPGETERAREEMTALLVGFGTGLSIAAVFLLYIALEAAKLLP